MTDPVFNPAYRYGALVTAIYDGDTIICDIDTFDHMWKRDEIIRLYGINCQEIKRSKSRGVDADDVQVGYDQRDTLIQCLGLDPADYPRKVKYHDVSQSILTALDLDGDGEPDDFDYRVFPSPVWIVLETIKDKSGKFGRLLGIIHKDGKNLNEAMRDVIGGVEFYDSKTYPADYPITSPSRAILNPT